MDSAPGEKVSVRKERMNFEEFLERTINGGIEGAKKDYKKGDPKLIGSLGVI